MTTRFGMFVPQGWKMDLAGFSDPVEQWEAMTEVAKKADEGSWDSIWLFDHFHTVPEPSTESTFECWTATARAGAGHQAGEHRPDGRLQRIPQPGAVRQDRFQR
ncbi:hypothetical protein [Kribbella qitaiheensis]|uniref:hypothetical protein n=1 Tax=Kribbella qitaiheensis TaxID=1544730 RepID=UPI001FE91F9A|nr:hypothetical protein [Kribbella qitaiheensis]